MQINRSELGAPLQSRYPVVPNHLPHATCVKTPLVFGTPVSDSSLASPLVLPTLVEVLVPHGARSYRARTARHLRTPRINRVFQPSRA